MLFFSASASSKTAATEDLLKFVDADKLLSTYGGNGPSFEDVMKDRQAEYSSSKMSSSNNNNNNTADSIQ